MKAKTMPLLLPEFKSGIGIRIKWWLQPSFLGFHLLDMHVCEQAVAYGVLSLVRRVGGPESSRGTEQTSDIDSLTQNDPVGEIAQLVDRSRPAVHLEGASGVFAAEGVSPVLSFEFVGFVVLCPDVGAQCVTVACSEGDVVVFRAPDDGQFMLVRVVDGDSAAHI